MSLANFFCDISTFHMKSQVFLDFLYIILLSVLDIANFFLSLYLHSLYVLIRTNPNNRAMWEEAIAPSWLFIQK